MDKKRDRGVALSISLLLHSLFALLPWQEKPRPLAVSSTPENPVPIVYTSQLPTLPEPESQPLPVDPIPPPVDPPPTPEAPITETNGSPIDEPAPEAAPYSDTVPETTPPAVPATPNSVTPADEAKIAADWDHLVGYLKEQDDGLEFYNLLGIFNTFGEPGQVNQFFDENNQPKLDVFSFYHFTKQTPEQVKAVVIPELTSNTGFDLQPQENFPAGRAYQLLQGEMLRYLIIVQLNEGSGSVLMLSDSLPGFES